MKQPTQIIKNPKNQTRGEYWNYHRQKVIRRNRNNKHIMYASGRKKKEQNTSRSCKGVNLRESKTGHKLQRELPAKIPNRA